MAEIEHEWLRENVITVTTLACWLPNNEPKRLPMLLEFFNGTLPCLQHVILGSLTAQGDTVTITELAKLSTSPIPVTAASGTHCEQLNSVAVLTWAHDQPNIVTNPVEVARDAIRYGNIPAFAWQYEQLTAEQIAAVNPAFWAVATDSVSILQWLHDHVGITCSAGCTAAPGTMSSRSVPLLDADVVNRPCSLPVLQWLNAHHPHLVTAACYDHAAVDGHLDTFRWLCTHRPDLTCPPTTLLTLLRTGQHDAVAFVVQNFPDIVSGVRQLNCRDCIVRAYNDDLVATLDWFLEHHRPALACLSGYDGQTGWPTHVWQWVFEHPEYTPWSAEDEAMYEWLDDRAFAAGYMEWLVQIVQDYKTSLAQLCRYGPLYKEQYLPFLQQLITDGLPASARMLLQCVENDNLVGARWLLQQQKQ
ncbi:hypothetical protein RI367_008345 [Sorochytrium milnesiophthora]